MRVLVLLFSLTLSAVNAQAGMYEECGESSGPTPYKYCIAKNAKSSDSEVLYFMHMGMGNEHAWTQRFDDLQREIDRAGTTSPVVITISFGTFWLLAEKDTGPEGGLLELFRDQIMKEMESKALGRSAKRRFVMGASMGGFNAAKLLLKLPKSTFDRAVIACPAMIDLSPWASEDEFNKFIKRTQADPQTIKSVGDIARHLVKDEPTWITRVNPLTLITSAAVDPSQFPPMLVIGNVEDYNFFEGAELFAKRAKDRGAKVSWALWPGRHCQLNSQAVAEFLQTGK